jgi:hypothetical protein
MYDPEKSRIRCADPKYKEAKRIYDKKRRAANIDQIRAYDRARNAVRQHRLDGILRNVRGRAARDGRTCTLTVHDIPPIPDICPVLGIPIRRNKGKGLA